MSWTPDEWSAFHGLLEEGWPGEFDDDAAASWRTLLDGTPPAAAVAGLRRLLHEGHRFRPSVSEMLAATRRDPSRPTFDEMMRLLYGRGGALYARPAARRYADEAERQRLQDDATREMLAAMHPLVGAFVERQGLARLRALHIDCPEEGHWRRRDLQQAWDAHVEAFEGREVAALAAGTGREGLHQLDPLAALGVPRDRKQLPAGSES